MIHQRRHPFPVEGCWACKIGSVSFAPSAMPSRNGGSEAQRVTAKENAWKRDMSAYRRLRREGLRPPQIDGSATLERDAVTADQVNTGLLHVKPESFQKFEDTFGRKATDPRVA